MKKSGPAKHGPLPDPATTNSRKAASAKIHPVIIYPFQQPRRFADLEELYRFIAGLEKKQDVYARPITVIDRKSHFTMQSSKELLDFRESVVSRCSEIVDAWCVDTCQMWYSGLGKAFESGAADHVYWLIPGDFDYGTALGKEVLGRLHDLPEIILELGEDLCIGEVATNPHHSKQLIDTYGTFALLYLWFPAEAREIREYTERPRSEFFAIRHQFLQEVLRQRWYAYEQTVVMLLQAVFNKKRISRFSVGNISDLPEGRESLAAAVQQVERMERVMKSVWRERNQGDNGWIDRYQILSSQSEQIRRTALAILRNFLS